MKRTASTALALGLVVTLAGPAMADLRHPGMPEWAPSNFDRVSDTLYRGGKITRFEQVKNMQEMGIQTVINLARDSLKKGENEIDWTKRLNMRYVPVYLGDQPPSNEKWELVKGLMQEGHAYVHCAHGADRTGAIVARYRQDVEGWPPEKAYREARKYGFKPWLKALRRWMHWE